jgi:hypothetical protein
MAYSRILQALLFFWIATLILGPTSLSAAETALDPLIDWAHLQDPLVTIPSPVVEWSEDLPKLWHKALQRREADVQREAADSMTRAHRLGMVLSPTLAKELTQDLSQVLDQPNQHPVTRTAAARALVQLDARQAAELLSKHAASGPIELTQLVEPALARWDYQPQRAIWLGRLSQGARPTLLQLAAEGVATVDEKQAIGDLIRLARSGREPMTTRLVAARALASIKQAGSEELARELAKKTGPRSLVDRLVAAHLLAQHSGDATLSLLDQLANDAEPAVAAQAMQRLLEIAPDRLISRAEQSLAHRDARVRNLTVRALATKPSVESIVQLAPQLDDPIVENRLAARRILLEMAGDEALHPTVVEQTTAVLRRDAWRGDEQAILILTTLEQKQVGPRYMELLNHSRPEVFVTAAWGLRKFARPDLIEPMFAAAKRLSEPLKNDAVPSDRANQLAQLLGAIGEMKYAPAESHLRVYVPKGPPEQARASAVWSLGKLLDGQSDPQLAKQLEGRLADVGSIPPEMLSVRAMCAITLGRLKSEPSLPVLREWYKLDTHNNYLGRCCGWAIERIAGEKLPDPDISPVRISSWFLEPLEMP